MKVLNRVVKQYHVGPWRSLVNGWGFLVFKVEVVVCLVVVCLLGCLCYVIEIDDVGFVSQIENLVR